MTERDFVCIVCPNGCKLHAMSDESGSIIVTGNKCKRGEAFAQKELTAPTRSVTTTVATKVKGYPVASVRTDGEIPKDKIKELVKLAGKIMIESPMMRGDVVLANVFDTGVNLIITTDMK